MNKIDNELYDFLFLFANYTSKEAVECMDEYKQKFNKEKFDWKIVEYSLINKYILIEDNKEFNDTYIITEKGLEILRHLENLKFNHKSFWISIIISIFAVIISILSFIKWW